MNKKKVIKISLISSGVLLLLFTVLIVHIAMVTNPKDKPYYGIQLSRIDFNTPLDTAQGIEVCKELKSIKGVGNAMANYQFNNIVFSYQMETTTGQEVFDQLIAKKPIDATRFVITQEELAKTAKCPVVNDKGIMKVLVQKVQLYFL